MFLPTSLSLTRYRFSNPKFLYPDQFSKFPRNRFFTNKNIEVHLFGRIPIWSERCLFISLILACRKHREEIQRWCGNRNISDHIIENIEKHFWINRANSRSHIQVCILRLNRTLFSITTIMSAPIIPGTFFTTDPFSWIIVRFLPLYRRFMFLSVKRKYV